MPKMLKLFGHRTVGGIAGDARISRRCYCRHVCLSCGYLRRRRRFKLRAAWGALLPITPASVTVVSCVRASGAARDSTG